jgi:hypothetical protein
MQHGAGDDKEPGGVPPEPPAGRRPGVYARLAEEAEVHRAALHVRSWVPWAGRAIVVAIIVTVILAGLQVHPW